jgi:hypothetical protein
VDRWFPPRNEKQEEQSLPLYISPPPSPPPPSEDVEVDEGDRGVVIIDFEVNLQFARSEER